MPAFKENGIVGGQKHLCSRVRKRLAMDTESIPSTPPTVDQLKHCFPKRRKLNLSTFLSNPEVVSVSSPEVLSAPPTPEVLSVPPTQPWQQFGSSRDSLTRRRSLRLLGRAQQ
jgi:hypothetical protein